MTPGRSIRAFCLECVGTAAEVRRCGGDKCLGGQGDEQGRCCLFSYRLGTGRPSVKLIRRVCLQCMGESSMLVAECASTGCHLHPYRFGRRPRKDSPETATAEGVLGARIDDRPAEGTTQHTPPGE